MVRGAQRQANRGTDADGVGTLHSMEPTPTVRWTDDDVRVVSLLADRVSSVRHS